MHAASASNVPRRRPPRALSAARVVALGALASGLFGGCKSRGGSDEEHRPPAPAPTITVANAFGICDDLAACERECDAGQADRCRRIGATFQFAQGSDKDDKKAAAYYELACGLGNASGCVSAGQMYEFAHGVEKNDAKAAAFYKKGCDVGYQVGCANYAIMLENGRGVPKDPEAAARLYDSACKAGAGLACERLHVLRGGADATTPPAPGN